MATEREPAMFLHIASKVKTKMEAAVGIVNRLINSELGPLVDERRFRRGADDRDEMGRRKWPEEKIFIGMLPLRGFHLRASVVGTGGSNVKFVQQETRTRIQIKGQGSGFEEVATGKESDEPMYLHVTGPDMAEVHRAKGMLEDLIASVRVKYDEFRNGGVARDPDPEPPAPILGANGLAPPPAPMNNYAAPGTMPAPPFSFSSAPPPPPGSMVYGSSLPPPPGATLPPPPGANLPPPPGSNAYPAPPTSTAFSQPPPPPGSSAPPPPPPPGSNHDAYDPYTPNYPRPPGT